MWQLFVGWFVLLVLIVLGARYWWAEDAPSDPAGTAAHTAGSAPTSEDTAFLNTAMPKCAEILAGFLQAGSPETRSQYVLAPAATATRMARYYGLNPLITMDPGSLTLNTRGVLTLPSGRVIETTWGAEDGKVIDVIFREENGEWRIDWEHLVRYGDYPWSLFLAGSGPAEGEFRLLARERLADAHKKGEAISIVMYAPRFAHPGEVGFQSPEFLVARNTRDGQLLEAAFKLAHGGGKVFDSNLPTLNPADMIRVRVKVRRYELAGERKFEIAAVVACHWYSDDDPGVVPAPLPENHPAAATEAPAASKPATNPPRLPNLKPDRK